MRNKKSTAAILGQVVSHILARAWLYDARFDSNAKPRVHRVSTPCELSIHQLAKDCTKGLSAGVGPFESSGHLM